MSFRDVGDLIDALQQFDRSTPIGIASGGYRTFFEYGIEDVVEANDDEGKTTVYVAEGSQRRYLPGEARDNLGW